MTKEAIACFTAEQMEKQTETKTYKLEQIEQ